ncbi:MAG: hypothetical protein ACP5HQ_07260 [Thermoprotei archaeon]
MTEEGSRRPVELQPWGVHVPFTLVAAVYFVSGGLSLRFGAFDHDYLMMAGAYALYEGMFLRLFFPATKYIWSHVATLATIAIPLPQSQAVSATFLTYVMYRGLKDVRSYGSRFPVNALVLASPVLAVLFWTGYVFTGYYQLLFPPLVSYVLGINVGIFAATLRTKPFFGWRQAPLLALAPFTFVPQVFGLLDLVYSGVMLVRAGTLRSTSSFVVASFLISGLFSLLDFDFVHAFAIGFMLVSFVNCIVYSTSRYNFDGAFHLVSVLSLLASNVAWPFLREASFALTAMGLVAFALAIRHNLTFQAIKYGISQVYLRQQLGGEQS